MDSDLTKLEKSYIEALKALIYQEALIKILLDHIFEPSLDASEVKKHLDTAYSKYEEHTSQAVDIILGKTDE